MLTMTMVLYAIGAYIIGALIATAILKLVDLYEYKRVNNDPRIQHMHWHRDMSSNDTIVTMGLLWPIFAVPGILYTFFGLIWVLADRICVWIGKDNTISTDRLKEMCSTFDSWFKD